MNIFTGLKTLVWIIGKNLLCLGAKLPPSPKFSLRTQFVIGMVAMLLPLILSVAVGHFYLLPRVRNSLEEVVEEVLEEMLPVMHLQNTLREAAMPPNDYLIHGDLAERENFTRLSQEVDRAFEEAFAAPYTLEEERALVQAAWEEWQQARLLSKAILALPNPVGNPMGAKEMERLDAHVDRAVELLEQQHVLEHREADELLATVQADRRRGVFLTLGVFGVALVIAMTASWMLAHSVLAPVRAIRQGAIRFSEGDLSYRVIVNRQDELGQLARDFNEMAERLAQSQAALEAQRAAEARRADEAETLRQAGAAVAATLQPEEAIERILEQLARVVPYDSASVQLWTEAPERPGEGFLEIVGGRGWPDPATVVGLRFRIPGDNPNTVVIQQRRPYLLGDAPAAYAMFREKPHSHIRSWLGVPLIAGEQVIGMLALDSAQANYFTEDHVRLVSAFANQVSIALQRAREHQAVKEAEARYHSLFENSPISLWEADFSRVVAYLDELRHSGVTDFRAYFENHPEALAHCVRLVKITDVNKATLKLYKAESKEDLLAGLDQVLGEEGLSAFREELVAIAEGRTAFEAEAVNRTLTGEKIHVALSWSVAPGYEKTYSVVFISINDITARKQAEEKLAATVTELEQHYREIKLLSEMGDLLQSCQTIVEASTVVAHFAQKLFPNQPGALYLIAASRNLVETVATWGESLPQDCVFTPDDCWALRRGQIHRVADVRSGLLCRHLTQPLPAGYLCVPMMAQGETLGVLHLQSSKPNPKRSEEEQETFAASQQQLAVTLAEHIALALANLKLRESLRNQAIRDPLTGLFNRRYMEETLERELRRAERRKAPLGVIMLDLDHFKRFNDTFGHAAGDIILREIGTFLQAHIRVEDIACRYGGEEFLIIFPEASLDDTLKRAEQLREGIKQLQVHYRDQMLGVVTVSLGVAAFPTHGSTSEAIMKAADAALYRAKAEGRDRVVVASTDTSPRPS